VAAVEAFFSKYWALLPVPLISITVSAVYVRPVGVPAVVVRAALVLSLTSVKPVLEPALPPLTAETK
jgi:hypothetical protein